MLAGSEREADYYKRMLPELAESMVVRPGRMRGIEGLRVADVYVLPLAGTTSGYAAALERLRTLRLTSGRSRKLRFVNSYGGWNEA